MCPKTTELEDLARLAMRVDGDMWIAYFAPVDTMDGAVILGAINIGMIIGHPHRKKAFLDLMRDLIADRIEEALGSRPMWYEPEAGH